MSEGWVAAAAPENKTERPRALLWGQLPPFTGRQWRVFAIATTGGFFDNYDRALLSLAMLQIQRGLRIAEDRLGGILSAIRLGYLLSFTLTPLADVFGRRRLLIYTIVGYTLFTALSALAPTAWSFAGFQFVARGFVGAEAIIACVILAEEVDAAVRGWAMGLLGMLVSTGWGLAALAFALINVVPYGWRGLYALALAPLALIIPLRRALPESHRFEEEVSRGTRPSDVLTPVASLFRVYPSRLWMIVAVSFLSNMGGGAVGFFYPKYLQEVHRWTPAQVTIMVIFAGAVGIVGNVAAGRLSDRYGRRLMGALFMFLAPCLAVAIFTATSNLVIPAWTLELFFDAAAGTILSAYSAELFPTSYRAAAGSALTVAGTLGGALGLYLEGLLYRLTHSHWTAVRSLTVFWMIAPVILLSCFPETAGLELEVIAPESPAAAAAGLPDRPLILRGDEQPGPK